MVSLSFRRANHSSERCVGLDGERWLATTGAEDAWKMTAVKEDEDGDVVEVVQVLVLPRTFLLVDVNGNLTLGCKIRY